MEGIRRREVDFGKNAESENPEFKRSNLDPQVAEASRLWSEGQWSPLPACAWSAQNSAESIGCAMMGDGLRAPAESSLLNPLHYPTQSAFAIRSRALTTFSRLLKALMRTCPSPHLPKPAPGVHTTLALSKRRSKNSQESRPVLIQI